LKRSGIMEGGTYSGVQSRAASVLATCRAASLDGGGGDSSSGSSSKVGGWESGGRGVASVLTK
jgi:hypothetical protein